MEDPKKKDEDGRIICLPRSMMPNPLIKEGAWQECTGCKQDIWLADDSLAAQLDLNLEAWCLPCMLKQWAETGEEPDIEILPEQMEVLKKHLGQRRSGYNTKW